MRSKVGLLFLFLFNFVLFANSSYLDNQPKWNWEEVILSRNGPSTTTTPRPKFWSEFMSIFVRYKHSALILVPVCWYQIDYLGSFPVRMI